MKKPALSPDSLLKYAAGVSALVVVSESASAASNIVSFSANQQITTGPAVNFAPFTGGLGTGSPSTSQLALQFCGPYNLFVFAHTGSDYKWIGNTAPYSFSAGGNILDTFYSLGGSDYTTSLPGSGSTMYFGFKNIVDSKVGWASVTNSSGNYFLTGFGMETGNVGSIQAGATAIPEPSASVALLALGALGVAALRRRNQAKAAANAA